MGSCTTSLGRRLPRTRGPMTGCVQTRPGCCRRCCEAQGCLCCVVLHPGHLVQERHLCCSKLPSAAPQGSKFAQLSVRGCAVHHVAWSHSVYNLCSRRRARGSRPAVSRSTPDSRLRQSSHCRVCSLDFYHPLRTVSSMTSLELSLRSPPVCWGLGRFRAHARCTPHPPQSVVSDHNSRTWKSHPGSPSSLTRPRTLI